MGSPEIKDGTKEKGVSVPDGTENPFFLILISVHRPDQSSMARKDLEKAV